MQVGAAAKIPNLIGNKWNTLTQTSMRSKEERFMWEDRQMTIFDYLNNKKYKE